MQFSKRIVHLIFRHLRNWSQRLTWFLLLVTNSLIQHIQHSQKYISIIFQINCKQKYLNSFKKKEKEIFFSFKKKTLYYHSKLTGLSRPPHRTSKELNFKIFKISSIWEVSKKSWVFLSRKFIWKTTFWRKWLWS